MSSSITQSFFLFFSDYYRGGNGLSEDYYVRDGNLKEGMYCAALYDKFWHRAQVLSANYETNEFSVCYFDYGTRAILPKAEIRRMDVKFLYLPAQAIKCRLKGIKPPNYLPKWPVTSGEFFLEIVLKCLEDGLVCQVDVHDVNDHLYVVSLYDTVTNDLPEGVKVTKALVDLGHAEYDSNKYVPLQSHVDIISPMVKYKQIRLPDSTNFIKEILKKKAMEDQSKQNGLKKAPLSNRVLNVVSKPNAVSSSVPHAVPSVAPNAVPKAMAIAVSSAGLIAVPNAVPNVVLNALANSMSTPVPNPMMKPMPNPMPKVVQIQPNAQGAASLECLKESGPSSSFSKIHDKSQSIIFEDFQSEASTHRLQKEAPILESLQQLQVITSPPIRIDTISLKSHSEDIHVIHINGRPFMTSCEISELFPKWKKQDLLKKMLKLKKVKYESLEIKSDKYEELFEECIV